ncbi:hypothetical protein PPL_04127 [Heterostelium album PN500]|uniref:CS domain-containing protein n=1 Tax=Heterostelium pallidum (strain ATCC 26659 / Pp 5 / PN500) TaxID=670386 RepID=D3B636_HETP5|nr:hypothetical protein PPL_04127 [Heterostelium album PN500]EFA83334.1 hypothetical protein PPL_04127 [Heterostelium album PN500]|eukprot:XP_020435451.1 hypothetical protein PPL_04127 [Heterostelium album PN500]
MEKFKAIRRKFEYQGRTIYEWDQTLEEVNIYIEVPEGVSSKMIACQITSNKLILGIRGNPPFIDEEFFSTIKQKDSFWTLEDGVINITLQKMDKGETWFAALKGHGNQISGDSHLNEEVKKSMMLERFQEENPGFDFSSAEFNGQAPDPRTFMKDLRKF